MIWNPWGEIKRPRADNQRLFDCNTELYSTAHNATRALNRIIAEEKPTSNATVKRIVRIARSGLEEKPKAADPRPEEQLAIQRELGISTEDHEQAWLRLHQLLKSHEDRITALEGGK